MTWRDAKVRPLNGSVEVFSTCPPSSRSDRSTYVDSVIQVARWSEQQGCQGILVYTDNSMVDPWFVSQLIIQNTSRLCPLVALQPVYMHPYTAAKMVASLAFLHGRRVYLNMVAGGFKNDLLALGDGTPHDRRYDRLQEYTTIVQQLVAGEVVTLRGEFYDVQRLRLTPTPPPELRPGLFISASSDAGIAAARALGATAVQYPKPAESQETPSGLARAGIRVGIIARSSDAEAWALARARFPEDREGQITHQLAMKVSDSVWHQQLSDLPVEVPDSPYWLLPFQNYKTFCPYLVGSHECVGRELGRYIAAGYHTFILDVPTTEDDLHHTNIAFSVALQRQTA